jgi:hypothetical protein
MLCTGNHVYTLSVYISVSRRKAKDAKKRLAITLAASDPSLPYPWYVLGKKSTKTPCITSLPREGGTEERQKEAQETEGKEVKKRRKQNAKFSDPS